MLQAGDEGIDVSKWQGVMDWPKAATRVRFAYIRASAGTYIDPRFAINWQQAQAAGVLRGAYHYFYADQPISAQLRVFADLVQGGELRPMLDVEETRGCAPAELAMLVKRFVEEFEARTRQQCGIYTSAGFWNGHVARSDWATAHPLWIAHWNAPAPRLPLDWEGCEAMFWQYGVRRDGPEYGAQSAEIDHDRAMMQWANEPMNLISPTSQMSETAEPAPGPIVVPPLPVTTIEPVSWLSLLFTLLRAVARVLNGAK